MKIDKDLRIAITTAARRQQIPSYHEQNKMKEAALAAFLASSSPNAKKAKRLHDQYVRAAELKETADRGLAELGLGTGYPNNQLQVESNEKFVKAGGVLPEAKLKWEADSVIAQLLSASDTKQFNAVLKKYGIVWK